MKRNSSLAVLVCITLFSGVRCLSQININTNLVSKAIVFLYASKPDGSVDAKKPLGTGFLVRIPTEAEKRQYIILVTARHIVDPQWAYCNGPNPQRLYMRMNKANFNPETDESGVDFVPVTTTQNGISRYFVSKNERVDAAVVVLTPSTFNAANFDFAAIPISDFASSEEIKQLRAGDNIASAGLVPGFTGEKRNYPFFKFGNVSSIPDESVYMACGPGPALRLTTVWFIAANLIPGNSGSPIFSVPSGAGGITIGIIHRPMLIGIQSMSIVAADLAGMTPVEELMEIVNNLKLPNADLTRGPKPKK